MSKINLIFDTKTKKLSVTKDGQTLDNVIAARFYNYYEDEKFWAEITMQKIDEDMTNTHMINADESEPENDKKKNKKKDKKWGY